MDKKKGSKAFSIGLLILLGSLLIFVVICFAIMFFSPGTAVFGFEYVNFSSAINKTYTSSTTLSVDSLQAVKIVTDCSAIKVNANETDSQIYLNYSRSINGFAKSENAELTFNDYITTTQTFEEDSTHIFRTLVIDITEPTGWISYTKSVVNLYLPQDISFEVVYCSSQNGDVTYNSTSNAKNITANNLYLTSNGGNISITNSQACDNYYLTTNAGSVSFNSSSVTADSVKFETCSGSMSLTNSSSTATFDLASGLFVKSSGDASVHVNNLSGPLSVEAQGGTFSFDNVGSESEESTVNIVANSSTFNFGNLYAQFSIYQKGTSSNDTVSIDKFVTSTSCTISSGSGNVTIGEVSAPELAVTSTTGNVYLQKIATTTSLYVYSSSGSIVVSYVESSVCVPGTLVRVFSKTGTISLSNISGFLYVEVLENSSFSRLDVVFSAVCHDSTSDETNIIIAKNRTANLTLKGYENDLICRILTQQEMYFTSTNVSAVTATDSDYLLSDSAYSSYSYEYRVGYTITDNNVEAVYGGKGKIFVQSTSNSNISFQD